MKKKVYFRADGNDQIGHGHVMRALAFAEMIKDLFSLTFIIQSPGESLKAVIRATCDSIIELPVIDISKEIKYLSDYLNSKDILVLDGYQFTSSYQEGLHQIGVKLVYIDDLANQYNYANAIINHSAGFTPQNYNSKFYTRYYLGPEYALLRKPFTDAAKEVRNKLKPKTLFINMGGADPINYTFKAIESALKGSLFQKINIVVGPSYKYSDSLEIFKSNPRIAFHSNLTAEKICELMKESEVAICSSSTIAYEYCSVGGLLFIVKTADNQKYLYDFLINESLAFDIKEFSKLASVSIEAQINNQKKYFDGKSPLRLQRVIANLILEEGIAVRKAGKEDMLSLFHWANDAEARSNSINKEPISLATHEKWFYSKLESKDSFIYILSMEDEDVGQVRFDYRNDYWLISFAVDKAYRRKGFGEILLSKSIEELMKTIPESIEFKAQVMDGNKASENIFVRLGFEQRGFEVMSNVKFYNFYKTSTNS